MEVTREVGCFDLHAADVLLSKMGYFRRAVEKCCTFFLSPGPCVFLLQVQDSSLDLPEAHSVFLSNWHNCPRRGSFSAFCSWCGNQTHVLVGETWRRPRLRLHCATSASPELGTWEPSSMAPPPFLVPSCRSHGFMPESCCTAPFFSWQIGDRSCLGTLGGSKPSPRSAYLTEDTFSKF